MKNPHVFKVGDSVYIIDFGYVQKAMITDYGADKRLTVKVGGQELEVEYGKSMFATKKKVAEVLNKHVLIATKKREEEKALEQKYLSNKKIYTVCEKCGSLSTSSSHICECRYGK